MTQTINIQETKQPLIDVERRLRNYKQVKKLITIVFVVAFLGVLLWFLPTFINAYRQYQEVLKIGGGSIDKLN